MTFDSLLILALIQGVFEFLPISSTAHLILAGKMLGVSEHNLAFDVAVHIGTLVAVVFFCRGEIYSMLRALPHLHRPDHASARQLRWLIYASLPVILAGFLLRPYVETWFRHIHLIAWASIGFGILLAVADRTHRAESRWTRRTVFIAGAAQCLALLPGVSRAGAVITAARFMGIERTQAARLALLLSVPVILGAGVLLALSAEPAELDIRALGLAAVFSCLAAFLSIKFLFAIIMKAGYIPFILYRIGLGVGLLVLY